MGKLWNFYKRARTKAIAEKVKRQLEAQGWTVAIDYWDQGDGYPYMIYRKR